MGLSCVVYSKPSKSELSEIAIWDLNKSQNLAQADRLQKLKKKTYLICWCAQTPPIFQTQCPCSASGSFRKASGHCILCSTFWHHLEFTGFWYWYTSHFLFATGTTSFTILTDLWLHYGSKYIIMNRTQKRVLCWPLNSCGRHWIVISSTAQQQIWGTAKARALQLAEHRLHTSKVNVNLKWKLSWNLKSNKT